MFLNYGTELELVLIPKSHKANRWDDVAKHLGTALTERRIPNEILEDSKTATFEKWIITGDGSVERDTKVNKWGLELISCIRLPFTEWRGLCSNVWDALTDRFEIVESDTCGTHVHVSWIRNNKLLQGDSLELLKYIAKAVIFFERCIDSLMPQHRVHNRFCKSNRYNVKLRSYTIWQIFEMIDEVEPNPGVPNEHKKLVDLLCPDDGNQAARYYK